MKLGTFVVIVVLGIAVLAMVGAGELTSTSVDHTSATVEVCPFWPPNPDGQCEGPQRA